jgi:hypothetical protein
MTALILRTLEELDGAEARLVLLDLPPMDVDRVSHLPHQFSLEVFATSVYWPFVVRSNVKTSISLCRFSTTTTTTKAKATRDDANAQLLQDAANLRVSFPLPGRHDS